METMLKIFGAARFFLAGGAIVAAVVGMGMQYNAAYIACIILILMTVAADVVVLILQRKLNIPVKYHENMFKFKKRK